MFGTLSVKHLKSHSDLLPNHSIAWTQAKSERFSLSNGRKPKRCLHGSFQYANSHNFDNHAHSLNIGFVSMQLNSSFASATSVQSLFANLLPGLSDHADKMVHFQNFYLWVK